MLEGQLHVCKSPAPFTLPVSFAGAAAPSDAEALAAEFDGFDVDTIRCILEDQGGDVKEVRFYLQARVVLQFGLWAGAALSSCNRCCACVCDCR